MEKELSAYAERTYKHVLFTEDSILAITQVLQSEKASILEKKPRRRAISIYCTVDHILGHAWVHIGTSAINLALVRGEIR